MLPQSPALEPTPADNREGKDETGCGRRPQGPTTGVQHGRGETRNGLFTSGHTAGRPAGGRHLCREDEPSGTEPGGRKPSTAVPKPVAARVFVLSRDGMPVDTCHPTRARRLLASGRAKVARHTPFTIRLTDRKEAELEVHPLQLKIDPGSRTRTATLLGEARLRAGLNRAEAAKRSGTSRSALLSYETGTVSPKLTTAARILAAYGFELTIKPVSSIIASEPTCRLRSSS